MTQQKRTAAKRQVTIYTSDHVCYCYHIRAWTILVSAMDGPGGEQLPVSFDITDTIF